MTAPRSLALLALVASSMWACAAAPPDAPRGAPPAQPTAKIQPGERHFGSLRQLTFGGENAEAYWSFDGRQLVFQSRPAGHGCDQIFRMTVGDPDSVERVSTGRGTTTCSYFMPGDDRIIYASTHLGGAACPPKPDRSQGYVWPLYESYDIFEVTVDAPGSEPVRLTDAPGYDAEATVCPVDGTILFTSVRDGDLELYKMGPDGSDVTRLTQTPGYDGGAFFNTDCSKIVWRASRPTGEALADYQRLLKQGLVRPTKLEIWVADADGRNARQVTYLDAASFAPYWFPDSDRILFSTNHGDPKGREFELWAVNADGTDLERITFSPGFDGFPMFSPDGQTLAFASNRATAPGAHDTNVFLVDWRPAPSPDDEPSPADRVDRDVAWLAAPERGGRDVGSEGLEQATDFVEERMKVLGLEPAFADGFRQRFEVTTAVAVGTDTALSVGGNEVPASSLAPLSGSSSGEMKGPLVFAGYGIVDEDAGIDDYADVEAKGKVVLVRRFVPASVTDEDTERRLSDLRRKAFVAKQRGAKALVVVDAPEKKGDEPLPEEAPFPALSASGYGDAGIPMVMVKREIGGPWVDALSGWRRLDVDLKVALEPTKTPTSNVAGRLPADASSKASGAIVIGAHLDHLGHGGPSSLAPDSTAPHLGADDNASGIAALLDAARRLAATPGRERDIHFVAFSAEELGVLGSSHFVDNLPAGLKPDDLLAMINMDMVGRLRDNTLQALGGGSAEEWPDLVQSACGRARVTCTVGGDGYGPSDQTPFYAAGVPVLHLFTGAHGDYHKPSDTPDEVNAVGVAKTAEIVTHLVAALGTRPGALTYRKVSAPAPMGDRRSFGASLGTVPDYAAPKDGTPGMRLADVRPGGASDQAGMKRGDILIRLGRFEIGGARDLMYALQSSKPGQRIDAVVIRDGKHLTLPVTLQESKRRSRAPHDEPKR